MNLTIERAPALSALSRVVGVVERKQTIPILANVALKAEGSILQVRATDLDMEAVERIPASIEADGEITVDASRLYDIVRNTDQGAEVGLMLGGEDPRMKVKAGRSNFKLPILSADAFPTFVANGLGAEFTMPAKVLANLLTRSAWAAIASDRSTLKGCVYLHTRDGQLRSVATDGGAIAVRREPQPEGAELDCILTSKLAGHISKWLGEAEGDVTVSASSALIRLQHDGATVTAKLWDGAFFQYERVLHETHDLTATTDRDALATALRRVTIMSGDRLRVVRMAFAPGEVTLTARGDGEGAETIAADYDGPKTMILMNGVQTASILDALRGDRVSIGFAEKADNTNRSGLVIVKAPADDGLLCNLMQMRA